MESLRQHLDENCYYRETSGNWRNIIFLPYNMLWKTIVSGSVFSSVILVIYYLIFTKDTVTFLLVFYVLEFIYFLDTTLTAMHRYMHTYRRTRLHAPKPMILLTLDILSLIPYYETYYLLRRSSEGVDYEYARDYVKFKVLLRLQTPIGFFFRVKNQPGLNQMYIVICGQMIQFILYSVFMSSIWFFIRDMDENNWQTNLKYHKFDRNSTFEWFVVCMSAIANTFAHNSAGSIGSENSTEYVLIIFTMMSGCLLHIMIFFGELTAQYIKKFQYQIMYTLRMNVIRDLLEDWKVEEKKFKQVMEFYNKFWEKRAALTTIPRLFWVIPVSLQKDVAFDVFWEMFRHSHFFNDVENSFKRSLAVVMHCKFYLPGDYLFRTNQLKVQMFYVVSGVVQILSQEDQKSPVMSFSSGTLFGEMTCLMAMHSSSNVRCATYCEIYTLELRELAKILINRRIVAKLLHGKLQKRLRIAKELQSPAVLSMKDKEQRRTSLKWIKTQWRYILSQTRVTKTAEENIEASASHMSNFLDLYVMSDDVELKIDAICLRSTCPYVMDPSSSFHRFCDYLILTAVILQTTSVPYMVFFQHTMTIAGSGWFYMMDMFYIFGIYLELSTAIKTTKKLVTESGIIFAIKCKKISTIVDIFATFPLEIAANIFNYSRAVQRVLHLNRTLKIHKLFSFLSRAESHLMINPLRLRLFKYIVTFGYAIYFCGCLLYGMACFDGCLEFGWLNYNRYLQSKLKGETSDVDPFLTSISYSVSTVLGLTDGNFYSFSLTDMMMEILVTMIGYFLFSLCFSELASCAVLQLNHKVEYHRYLKALTNFLNDRKVDQELKRSAYSYVQCHWQYSRRYPVTGDTGILRDASDKIKNTIVLRRIVQCLKQVPFFGICDEVLLWNVASLSTIYVVPPNTVLCYENIYCQNLKVIMRGYCKAESSIPTDKYHGYVTSLTVGDMFPILEVLLHVNSFQKVTTETFVEYASIPFTQLKVQLEYMPEFSDDLYLVLKQYITLNDTILMRRKGRLPEMKSVKKSLGKGDYFTYETNEKFDVNIHTKIFAESYSKLGKWKFLRHFFLPRTLNPTKRVFVTWECIRCALALSNTVYVLLFMKQTYNTSTHVHITRLLDAIGFIDLYIKMHCEYYNENGILVTHPLYTAKHYLSTSFALDLYCTFPFVTFHLNRIFHSEYEYRSVILATLITRPMQIYRVIFGLTYLQMETKEGKTIFIQRLKYGLSIVVILGVIACFLELNVCHYSSSTSYECIKDSWILRSVFSNDTTAGHVIFICYYQVLTIFSTSSVGIFIMTKTDEIIINLCISLILLFVRWFILAKVTSSAIGGDTTLVTYQNNMKIFLKFMRQNNVREELIKKNVEHYENIWKRTKGVGSKKIFVGYPMIICNNITMSIFVSTFKLVEIFKGADVSTLRYFAQCFTENFHKVGAEIIRCNDVQEYIYIVHKGKVEISVANTRLSMLTAGGMFGCMRFGKTRQTITAQAKVHVHLLRAKSSVFLTMMNQHPLYPTIKKHLRTTMFLNSEYFPPLSETGAQDDDIVVAKSMKTRLLINSNSKLYAAYDYITNVHIAVISSMGIMVMIVKVGNVSLANYYYVGYALDLFYWVKFFVGFLLIYIDHDSGWVVTSPRLIFKRYMRLFDGFWLNLFTSFPFELFTKLSSYDDTLYRFLWSNRVIRFLFMVNYYAVCKNKLTVSRTLRWTYLMYIMIFLIHLMSCVWWLVACPNERCKYLNVASHTLSEFIETSDPRLAFRICYQYVVTVFTSTGMRDQIPLNIHQIATSIAMICISQIILIALTSGFASMLVLKNFQMSLFERDVGLVQSYLKTIEVSLSLRNKIENYFKELWIRNSGSWLPDLICQAPPYLKQDMMLVLFGHHLTNHVLFGKTHIDFIRQLVVHLQPHMYMPGQYVVEKGDIDGTMYFINDGEIIVYKKTGSAEIEQCVLHRGRSFGVNQGLSMTEHVRSYKASVVTMVIALRNEDWAYLLAWFPASREILETREKMLFDSYH